MKKFVCFLTALSLFISLTACKNELDKNDETNTSKEQSTDTGNKEENKEEKAAEKEKPLEFSVALQATTYTKNNIDVNDTEEKKAWDELANTKIKYITPPDAEYKKKLSIMLASGDVPDAAYLHNPQWVEWHSQNSLVDLTDYAKNSKTFTNKFKDDELDVYTIGGRRYGIPVLANLPNKSGFMMRKDWLDNLGLKEPETLEDYKNVLKAFTYNDPDQNGKNDTFGGTFRANFKYMEGFLGAFDIDSHEIISYDRKGGELVPQQTQQKYKDYLAYMRNLWIDGVFTPNSMVNTSDQWKKEMFTGIAGLWYHSNTRIDEFFLLNLKKTLGEDSKASLCAPKPPLGPDGRGGNPSQLKSNGAIFITTKAKEPERIFRHFDWAFTSSEAVDFAKYGVEGKHHKVVDGKKEWIPEVLTSDYFTQLKELTYLYFNAYVDDEVADVRYGKRAVEIHKQNEKFNRKPYADIFIGKPMLQQEKDYPDLDKIVLEYTMKIVTGELELDAFDEMVEKLEKAGLNEVTAARNEWYKANNAK